MNHKKTFVALIAVLVIAIAGTVSAQISSRDQALREQMLDFARFWPNLVQQFYPDVTASPVSSPVFGSVTGPDSFFDAYNANGIVTYPRRVTMRAATTTPCIILSPAATTSLNFATIGIHAGTSTAGILTIATSTSALKFATTTPLATITIPSGGQFYARYSATTTNDVVLTTTLAKKTFAPNTALVFGVAGAAGDSSNNGFTYGGACQAEFVGF